MTRTHWLLIIGFLVATSSIIGGLDHWADLSNPKIVAGFLGQMATLLGAIFTAKPGDGE